MITDQVHPSDFRHDQNWTHYGCPLLVNRLVLYSDGSAVHVEEIKYQISANLKKRNAFEKMTVMIDNYDIAFTELTYIVSPKVHKVFIKYS